MRKGCAGHLQNAILPQFLTIEPRFVRKGCGGHLEIAILPQFLAIEPRFVRKGCAGHLQIAILPQFLAIEPHFVRKGCVSCRLVGTAPAPAFRREIEKKRRARGFLRGRRGTWRHSSSFHVAGVVLGDIHLRFTWQAWYSTYSHTTCSHATYSHATYSRTTCTHTTYSRRRRTWRYGSSLCVAGVARMALGWLWWRARFPRARVVAAAFCVAGVALGDIHLRFTWQAWHLVTSTFVSRARRGTRLTHFAWQAWHVWHWASSGGALGSHVPEWSPRLFAWQAWQLETFIFVSRGRRGTWWHPPSFHVAGVVLDLLTHNLFTHNLLTRNLLTHNLHTYNLLMQAWHLETWIVTLRGRRGTYGTGLALVACSVPTCPSGRRGFLRGRRGTWRHSSSFHAAEVVLGDIHLRFTWQAWYSTYSLCVAGVARMALG